jgi:glycerol-3-phosphate dehydrogenase (NAD(P)+)
MVLAMMKVTVLGAGSWGTTVAAIACRHNKTTLWARRPDTADEINADHVNSAYLKGFPLPRTLRATADLQEAVGECDVLVVGVPSQGFREVITKAADHMRPWIPVVSLTKGFERDTYLRMTQVIKQVVPGHPAAALTGPNLAKEIMAGLAAASVIATEDMAVANKLQEVLHVPLFRLYTNDDVIGCEVAGALKNVIAIAAGMAEGLSAGDNTRAAVISRGLAELTRLGVAMGGHPATFAGLAGMGDLIATCMSPQSRNRYVGEQLGRGRQLPEILEEMNMVAEGVKTAETVSQLAASYGVDMPICAAVRDVITGVANATDAYRGLLRGRPGHERGPI